jgi:hypothetical protein
MKRKVLTLCHERKAFNFNADSEMWLCYFCDQILNFFLLWVPVFQANLLRRIQAKTRQAMYG